MCLALVAAGCSGSKPATKIAATAAPDSSPDASAAPDATAGPDGLIPSGSSGSVTTPGKAKSVAKVSAPGQKPTITKDASGLAVANLFSAEENLVGISADQIKICLHAAFVLGDVFNNKAADEDVYWRKINAEGGIFGRKVTMDFQDDQYSADTAITVANKCKDNKNFFIMSGVGFDQIPRVREWAEQNRQLYFHTMATEDGSANKQFSFATAPTLQTVGRQVAQHFLANFKGKKFAVMSRRSVNWDAALDSFKAELKRNGSGVVAEYKVDNAQGNYSTEINGLKSACPQSDCVIFANENVLNFAQIYQQAENAPYLYRPRWFNYGFQLTNDTLLSGAAKSPALQAWYPTPAFDGTNTTNQPWWPEVQAMKAAYDKYCTGSCSKKSADLNDVDWQFWVGFKQLHQMLLDCGKDCSRNRMVGMLLSGYKTTVAPLCPVDFSRGDRHFGAHYANVFESVVKGSSSVFKQIATCKETF